MKVLPSVSNRLYVWKDAIVEWMTTFTTQQQSPAVMTYADSPSQHQPPPLDLRRVRELQQERATQRALKAEQERKVKAALEKKRRNEIALEKWKRGGHILGQGGEEEETTTNTTATSTKKKKKKATTSSSTSSSSRLRDAGDGYNPMQPWSSASSGYRPARRQVNRG
uniref:Uncharacterized protein n=1 Tax=Entomoneis paludosa TaxID=265537 RepID=A0A7S2YPV4_9STRA